MNTPHDYWRSPNDGINQPWRYRDVSPERSIFLVNLFARWVPKDMPVLEIGPNCGRNLAHLYESGWRDLHGIEPNPDAIRLMRETYPQLRGVDVKEGFIEDYATGLGRRQYAVFTMAVFEHVPYSSDWVFKHVARASRVLITVEDERESNTLHFPRNYRSVFEGLGLRQRRCVNCSGVPGLGRRFFARVFTPR